MSKQTGYLGLAKPAPIRTLLWNNITVHLLRIKDVVIGGDGVAGVGEQS